MLAPAHEENDDADNDGNENEDDRRGNHEHEEIAVRPHPPGYASWKIHAQIEWDVEILTRVSVHRQPHPLIHYESQFDYAVFRATRLSGFFFCFGFQAIIQSEFQAIRVEKYVCNTE